MKLASLKNIYLFCSCFAANCDSNLRQLIDGVSVECHASSISRIDRRALGWLFRAAFRSLWASSRYCVAGY